MRVLPLAALLTGAAHEDDIAVPLFDGNVVIQEPRFIRDNVPELSFFVVNQTGEMLRHYAEGRSMSLGKAASKLVRRGLSAPRPTRIVNDVCVVDLPPASPRITTKKVNSLESELE